MIGSILNFIPIGQNGYMIELSPIDKNGVVRWHWCIRLNRYVMKCISSDSYENREMSFLAALQWWENESDSYWV
jgi:hypothetical protein